MKKKLMFGVSMENMSNFDVFLFKIGVFIFTLFLVSAIPIFANWVTNTHWGWFLGPFIVIWIFVMKALWKKG